jgi:hypothetical protein
MRGGDKTGTSNTIWNRCVQLGSDNFHHALVRTHRAFWGPHVAERWPPTNLNICVVWADPQHVNIENNLYILNPYANIRRWSPVQKSCALLLYSHTILFSIIVWKTFEVKLSILTGYWNFLVNYLMCSNEALNNHVNKFRYNKAGGTGMVIQNCMRHPSWHTMYDYTIVCNSGLRFGEC